jgi:hypothetical protein
MTKYACGHETEIIIIDNNPLSLSATLEWANTVGRDGDKTLCWMCWCRNIHDKDLIKYVSENQGEVTVEELKEKFHIDDDGLIKLMLEHKIQWFPRKGKLYVWLHMKYEEQKTSSKKMSPEEVVIWKYNNQPVGTENEKIGEKQNV